MLGTVRRPLQWGRTGPRTGPKGSGGDGPSLERRWRYARFAMVGTCCFLFQLSLLLALVHLGIHRTVAYAVAFFASAQLNFCLSVAFTWVDRPGRGWRTVCSRLASYNGTALAALGLNTIIFSASNPTFGVVPAAMLGTAGGMTVTYLVSDLLIFRARRIIPSSGVQGP